MKNPLDGLNEEAQQSILQLAECSTLSEREIVNKLNDPKNGGSVRISRGGFRAFRQRKKREQLLDQMEEIREKARQIANEHSGTEAEIEQGTMALLRHRLFAEAIEDMEPKELLAMSRMMQQREEKRKQLELAQKKSDMAEEYLKLARERLQLTASKLALDHAEELRGLIAQGEVGDEGKVQGALARLFGEKFAKAANVQIEETAGKATNSGDKK